MLLNSNFKINSYLISWAVILLCLVAIVRLQIPQLDLLLNQSKNASLPELKLALEAEKAKLNLAKNMPSLGFNNLISNWVMLNFIQYFGDNEVRDRTGYDLSPAFFEIIIDRDPNFLESYVYLSSSITIYAAKPEVSVALMEKGLKSLSPDMQPKYYYIWRYKAIDELLFLDKAKDAQRSFETAANWAALRSDPESQNVAAISRSMANFLAKNPASKSAQVGAWSIVLGNAVDDRIRKLAIDRIQKLGGQVIVTPEGAIQVILPKKD